jgi:choline kinase
MKALILAAGLGSRLQHKTKNIPKAMVEVNGLPIITHQLLALKENDIIDVGIVLGYKGGLLKQYLLDSHPDIHFSFFINNDYSHSNSAYSFYIASEYIKNEHYIHLNCDILFSAELLNEVINLNKDNVIAVNIDEDLSDNMELVELDESNKIISMDNVLYDGAVGKAYGLAKLSPDSSSYIIEKIRQFLNDGDYNQNYYGIIRQAVNQIEYYCLDSGDMLLSEINTLLDYDRVLNN